MIQGYKGVEDRGCRIQGPEVVKDTGETGIKNRRYMIQVVAAVRKAGGYRIC